MIKERCKIMKGKALAAAAILLAAAMLGGCEVKEEPAETDSYSRVLCSDTASGSVSDVQELDVSRASGSSRTDSSADSFSSSEGESSGMSESSSKNSSASTASVTHITEQQTTTYYYYYEPEESDRDSDVSSSDAESTDSDLEESDSDIGSETDTGELQTDTDGNDTDGSFDESDLEFVTGAVRIKAGDRFDEYMDALGEPIHITEIKDGEGDVICKTYSYEDFSVNTVADSESGSDTVASIEIFSDNISTEKGAKVGMKIEDAAAIYGSDWMLCGEEYRYYKGSSYMYFYVQNGIVANIGYNIDKDMEN